MRQQGFTVLVELSATLTADAVHHQMVVEVAGVHVGGDHHLIVGKRSLCQFQTDGVSLLGCEVVIFGEGLDEVVELPAVRFSEPLLGGHHLQVGRLRYAVAPGDQTCAVQYRLLRLHYIG